MKPIRQWFAPDLNAYYHDVDWSGLRWYQKPIVDRYGDRFRITVGDLCSDMETDTGDYAGVKFAADLELWADTGQFDEHPRHGVPIHYHDHDASLIFWRWGIYVAVRGARKPS